MNNNWTSFIITLILSSIALTSCIVCCQQNKTSSHNALVKYDTSRNYQYEHYCDSVYEVDPDYYHDVLVESDSFQNYIEEHGQWWEK